MPDPAHLRHARLSRRASAMANLHSMARKSSAYGLHSPTSSKRHSSDPMSSEAHVKEESDLYRGVVVRVRTPARNVFWTR